MRAITITILIAGLSILLPYSLLAQLNGTSRPNIVLIIADDMRYDSFKPTGGPTWFNTPSISRLADEGATFENYFCVYSLCIPSRSSIMTGLYPHSNGAYDNFSTYFPNLPTIASILDSAGYNTAMIGKYHVYKSEQEGWDYWMAKIGETDYEDPQFNVNGIVKTISGNTTQIINDSSGKIISVTDTPFFVCIEHQAAHQPITVLPQHDDIYADEDMPIPPAFYQYTSTFPSFLYEHGFYEDTARLIADIERYFEGLQGLETNAADIFDILASRNLLNNTLILFTSDNGFLQGEHELVGKGLPYEESIRVPLFIRYRPWFSSKIVVDQALASHVDIAPTLLEAAGINSDPYHFQGYSLRQIALGEIKRNFIMYENIKLKDLPNDDDATPSIRTLRSQNFKYNLYQCDEQTEEFFNLNKDPNETTNLIDDPFYASVIDSFRIALDSMRIILYDTLSVDTFKKPCFLSSTKSSSVSHTMDNPAIFLHTSPNPFSERFEISALTQKSDVVEIIVYNELGQPVFTRQVIPTGKKITTSFDTGNLPDGIYMIRIRQGDEVKSQYLLKSEW